MWLMLLGFIVVALVVCVFVPEARRPIGVLAAGVTALLLLAVAAEVVKSISQARRELQAQRRIAPREIQLDGMQLTAISATNYRLTGVVHNLSPTWTLTDVRFWMRVEDCVNGACREQARGHVEVIRRVPPNQASVFSTEIVSLPAIAPPLGERRLSYDVYLTVGQP